MEFAPRVTRVVLTSGPKPAAPVPPRFQLFVLVEPSAEDRNVLRTPFRVIPSSGRPDTVIPPENKLSAEGYSK